MEIFGATRVAVVIEDEEDIRNLLETVLTQAGFTVIATGNGLDGLAAVHEYNPVVTTLDVNMPGMDGFETARRIRAFSSTYIVMLTALNEEIDVLQGLEAGADDYINKPFRPRELRARIEAMLRRPRALDTQTDPVAVVTGPLPASDPVTSTAVTPAAEPTSARGTPVGSAGPDHGRSEAEHATGGITAPLAATLADQPEWLTHNGLELNAESREVRVDGVDIDLTRSEFDLLVAILDSHRRVRSKADLVLMLRGEAYVTSHFVSDADKRAIEVHMANLRKKLGDSLAAPRWIETVRGVGYRLTATDR